jgi:hypothetical protein
MAQTKTKPKGRSAPKRAKSSSKSTKSKAAKKAVKAKSKASAPKAPSSNGARSNGSGNGLGKVVSKAKLPLVAGGAAVAGAAGGLALASSKQARKSRLGKAMMRRPKVKLDSKDLTKAAKEVGNFGAQVGELATELQRARESADGKKHRSPIEVVLQGLTARR